MNKRVSAVSGSNRSRFLSYMSPAVEKRHCDGTDFTHVASHMNVSATYTCNLLSWVEHYNFKHSPCYFPATNET